MAAPLPMTSATSSSTRITPYLLLLVLIATLGPLQFGYHIVRLKNKRSLLANSLLFADST